MRAPTSFAALAWLAPAMNALQIPTSTNYREYTAETALIPTTTNGPKLLVQRADSVQNVLVGPNPTCGYVRSDSASYYLCPTQNANPCLLFLPTASNTPGTVGCCTDISTCGLYTTCVNSAVYSSSGGCNSACQSDNQVLKCTVSEFPICNTFSYTALNVQGFFCDNTTVGSVLAAETTYPNELQPSPFTTSAFTRVGTDTTSSTSTSTSSSVSPSATGGGGGGGGTSTGAIVGGVVGGIAAIALIGTGVFFLLRKKKSPHTGPTQESHDLGQQGYYIPGQEYKHGQGAPGMMGQQHYAPVNTQPPVGELGGGQIQQDYAEMPAEQRRQELA